MGLTNGVWHDVKLDPPGTEFINRPVLAVREIGEGKKAYRKIDICIFNSCFMKAVSGEWIGNWNKRGVIFWMPLPKIPEEEK